MSDPLFVWSEGFWQARPALDHHPNRRPLYTYRLTDDEFRCLQRALHEKLAVVSSPTFLAERNPYFSGLVVMYAAEWWRRRYTGAGWEWQPILRDLGVKQGQWLPTERGQCVERGLRYWHLDSTKAGGLRYLKAIALQGGLPMALLADAKGKLGQVLVKVLRLAKGGTSGPPTIRSWVESLAENLPKSYREEVIYELLADVVVTTLELVREAGLTSSVGAITQLDERRRGWRDRFPLPVGDREAQGLIEQLIRDAVTVPAPSQSYLKVGRWLDTGKDEFWNLHSSMDLPDKLRNDELLKPFAGDDESRRRSIVDAVGRAPSLRLEAGRQTLTWGLQRLAGHDAYRVQRHLRTLSGEAAADEHRLLLRAADGRTWLTPARRGEALDAELPWLFEEKDGEEPRWVRQGGGGYAPRRGSPPCLKDGR